MDKTTREYAKWLAETTNLGGEVAFDEDLLEDGFVNGYLRAIEETNVNQLQEENERLREALENIEKMCDNDNPSHEVIWGIAFTTLSQKP